MGQMKLSSIPYENVITIIKKLRNREYIETFRSCKAMKNIAEKRDYRPVLQNDEEKKLSIHFFSRYFSPQLTAASGMVLNVDLDDSFKHQQAAISSTLKQLEGEIFTSIRICSAANSTHFELFCRKVCKLLKEYNITSRHMKWDIEDRQELMSQVVDDLKCASLSTGCLKDAKFLHTNDRIICIRTPKPLFDPILFSKCTHLKFSSMARLEEEVFLCRNQLSQFTKTIMLLHSFGKYQESLATKDTLSLGMGSISLEMVTNSYTKDAIIDYTKRVCKENSFQKIYDIPSDEYEDSCRIQVCYGVMDTSENNSNGQPVPLVISCFFYIHHFNGRMRYLRASLNFKILRSTDQLRFGANNLPFRSVAPPLEFVKFQKLIRKKYFGLKKKRSLLRFFNT